MALSVHAIAQASAAPFTIAVGSSAAFHLAIPSIAFRLCLTFAQIPPPGGPAVS